MLVSLQYLIFKNVIVRFYCNLINSKCGSADGAVGVSSCVRAC